jgi:hypothetical protein
MPRKTKKITPERRYEILVRLKIRNESQYESAKFEHIH